MGTGSLVRGIDYRGGFGAKQMAWMLHCGVMGAVLAPMCMLGGPVLIRAAWYTAGVVGGSVSLSIMTCCGVCRPWVLVRGRCPVMGRLENVEWGSLPYA